MEHIMVQDNLSSPCQIFVRTLSGRTAAIDVLPNDTVASLKAILENREGIPPTEQCLVYAGRHLRGPYTLNNCGISGGSTLHLLLRIAGGKGGFGSNLRAAGKQKLTDNYDACRDLQGRRIRHKTAADKLVEWQSEAQERELEKVAMRHLKDVAKAEKRQQVGEVDVGSVRDEKKTALAGVQSAVAFALQKNGSGNETGGAAGGSIVHSHGGTGNHKNKNGAQKRRRMIDPLNIDGDSSDSEVSEMSEALNDSSDERYLGNGNTARATRSIPQEKSRQIAEPEPLKPTFKCSNASGNKDDEAKHVGIEKVTAAAAAGAMPATAAEKKNEKYNDAPVEAAPVEPLDFAAIHCVEDLQALGLERLKVELAERGLKCGGTLGQRAERLFLLKNTPLEKLDKKHFAVGAK